MINKKYTALLIGITLAMTGCTAVQGVKKDNSIKSESKQEIVNMNMLNAKTYTKIGLSGRGGILPDPENLFEKSMIKTEKKGDQYVYTDNMAGLS